MSQTTPGFWEPREIRRHIASRESSTQIILVNTDLGDGYLKAIGNPEGEHTLACEWVGTQLARWFGLPTFEFGIIRVTTIDELPFRDGTKGSGKAKPGPGFITKADAGEPWAGQERELEKLVNPQDITRLIVFDTWVRNADRYYVRPDGSVRKNYYNVFLSEDAPSGQLLLRAMDFSHAFTNGREIIPKYLAVEHIQDGDAYGLFPEFRPFLDRHRESVRKCAEDLRRIDKATVETMVGTLPAEWKVSTQGRQALVDFIMRRAAFLTAEVSKADRLESRIMTILWHDELFSSDVLEERP